jgi:hypothetical protein
MSRTFRSVDRAALAPGPLLAASAGPSETRPIWQQRGAAAEARHRPEVPGVSAPALSAGRQAAIDQQRGSELL